MDDPRAGNVPPGSGSPAGDGEAADKDVDAIARQIKSSAARIAGYVAASGSRRREAAGGVFPPTRLGFLSAIAALEADVLEEQSLIAELKAIEPWLP